MAKFLTTQGNTYFIEEMIMQASTNLVLVTPYLKLTHTFYERLQDANRSGIKITLIYGKSELNRNEKANIEKLDNLEIYFHEFLHAKCYHNEKSMIISSMNLYEFSEKNNREMGVYLTVNDDKEAFENALKEIESIKNASKKEKDIQEITKTESNNGTAEEKINTGNNLEFLMDKKFMGTSNFYFPSLVKLLVNEFPNLDYKLNTNKLILNNLIDGNVKLIIDGTIQIRLEGTKLLKNKRNLIAELSSKIPSERFFSRQTWIAVYKGKDYDWKATQEDLERVTRDQFDVICSIKRVLNENL